MTLIELKNKLVSEKHVIGALQIECGRKVEAPGILGIYEEAGEWYVYDTNDRGGIVVLDKGNENEMTDTLYRRVLKTEKRLLAQKGLKTSTSREMAERYLNIYKSHSLRECLVGLQSECRISNRDSYLSCITDPEVFLEYVIYPLYLDGDTNVLTSLLEQIDFLILSENPIEFFQSINYLCGEKILDQIYDGLPFYIFDEHKISLINSRLSEMMDKMKSYREGDFSKYTETMYDIATRILKKYSQ